MAEEDDDASKTEAPSHKKIADARNKGQVAQSQEVRSWAILLGGAALLMIAGPWIANNVRRAVLPFIESPHAIDTDFEHLRLVMANTFSEIALILSPVFAVLFILAILSQPNLLYFY